MVYDEEYTIGRAKVYIISPETVLGRKMTDEEKQIILDDIAEKKSRIALSIALREQEKKDRT